MMQMRQKNLFVIVVLPSIFQIDRYVALHRTKNLIHVYENKSRRGYFVGCNAKRKKLIYLTGAKTYSMKQAFWNNKFKGRFYGVFALRDSEAEKEYRTKKEKALMEMHGTDKKEIESKVKYERKVYLANLYVLLKKYKNMSQENVVKQLKKVNIEMDNSNLSKIYREIVEKKGILEFGN